MFYMQFALTMKAKHSNMPQCSYCFRFVLIFFFSANRTFLTQGRDHSYGNLSWDILEQKQALEKHILWSFKHFFRYLLITSLQYNIRKKWDAKFKTPSSIKHSTFYFVTLFYIYILLDYDSCIKIILTQIMSPYFPTIF